MSFPVVFSLDQPGFPIEITQKITDLSARNRDFFPIESSISIKMKAFNDLCSFL